MGCLRTALTNRLPEQRDLYDDKARDGSLTIQPGEMLVLRYRVLSHHGDAAKSNVAEAYRRDVEGKY